MKQTRVEFKQKCFLVYSELKSCVVSGLPIQMAFCLAPTCKNEIENLEHILTSCPSLEESRMRLHATWLTKAVSTPFLHQLLVIILWSSPKLFFMFMLDPSTHPEMIALDQKYGNWIMKETFYLTRTWCQTLYKQRLQNLGRFDLG